MTKQRIGRTMAGLLPIIETMRAMVPAKDFEISKRFYLELGFSPQTLSDQDLIAMHFGTHSFILQDYYVEEWANNFVMHVRVSRRFRRAFGCKKCHSSGTTIRTPWQLQSSRGGGGSRPPFAAPR